MLDCLIMEQDEPSELVLDWLRSAWKGSAVRQSDMTKSKIVILDPPQVSADLSIRDKKWMRYGIELALVAASSGAEIDLSDKRIEELYRQRLAIESKGCIKV